MEKKITAYLPDSDTKSLTSTVKSLKETGVVDGHFYCNWK